MPPPPKKINAILEQRDAIQTELWIRRSESILPQREVQWVCYFVFLPGDGRLTKQFSFRCTRNVFLQIKLPLEPAHCMQLNTHIIFLFIFFFFQGKYSSNINKNI